MATWLDFVALILTVTVIGGLVYGVIYVIQSINEGVSSTKASLKERGLDVSASGVSIKTSKRFEREDYVDATQRGIVKAMGASSFRRSESSTGAGVGGGAGVGVGGGAGSRVSPPSMQRKDSSASAKSAGSAGEEKKKKKSIFGKK